MKYKLKQLKMTNYLVSLILFSLIIALGSVHGRTLYRQRPLLASLVRPNSIIGDFNVTKGGSPKGSVPILRTGDDPITPRVPAKAHCSAVVRTTNGKFYGSHAEPSLNKPRAEGSQWSTGRIKLSNGPDTIEAGWIVYPDNFKDNEAHLYAKFHAGSTECLNTNCPGFVQVDSEYTLGNTPAAYSVIGGQQVTWILGIDKHEDDGNWWLSLVIADIGTRNIGYWPGSLFTSLKDAATQVEWGGEINDPGAAEPAPAMGNSFKADYNQYNSAFLQHVTVVDENRNILEPAGTEKFADCPELYTVLDWGDKGGREFGRVIFYGGSQPRS